MNLRGDFPKSDDYIQARRVISAALDLMADEVILALAERATNNAAVLFEIAAGVKP
jgi:hypothetical protein